MRPVRRWCRPGSGRGGNRPTGLGPPWANWVTGRAGRPGSSQDSCPSAASSSRPSARRGLPELAGCGSYKHRLRLAGVRPRSGDEPGAGQERYADHKRDGCPDQMMSLMNAPHHEMQRVRCAGHVENPCDDRQDADDRQDDGQRPPAGRRGCGMHVIHCSSARCRGPPSAVGPRRDPARMGCRAVVDPRGGRAGGSPACGNSAAPTSRSRSSRQTRKMAAATPSASVPGPRAAGSGHPRSCQRTSPPPMPDPHLLWA